MRFRSVSFPTTLLRSTFYFSTDFVERVRWRHLRQWLMFHSIPGKEEVLVQKYIYIYIFFFFQKRKIRKKASSSRPGEKKKKKSPFFLSFVAFFMGFGGGGRVFPICDLSRQAPTGMFHVVFVQFINHDDTLPAQSCTRCYYIQWRIIKIESINFSLPTCLDYLSTFFIGW